MPLENAAVRRNLTVRYYPSGHMIYLDGPSRTALKAELVRLYAAATEPATSARILARQKRRRP
jgi:carboxypeptidase C (cathepsin A)